MSGKTAIFLAGLSHQGFPAVLAATVLCGALVYVARGRRLAVRIVAQLLFGASSVVFLMALFHFGCASTAAHERVCASSMKRLGMGMLLYAADNGDRYPPADRWADVIGRDHAREVSGCPAADTPYAYGMNSSLGGISQERIEEPARTVLLFEADSTKRSFAGGGLDMARERHGRRANVGFSDGYVKSVRSDIPPDLKWLPSAKPIGQ